MRLFVLSDQLVLPFMSAALEQVLASDAHEVVGVCVNYRAQPTRLEQAKRELKKGRGGYVAVMAIDNLARAGGPPLERAEDFFARHDVPIRPVKALYSDSTVDFIHSHAPDAIVRAGFGIIREPLLSLAPKGMISYHHGDIRRYRGQPVAFWELYHEEREMAVTVQVLEAGLDSGKIVVQMPIPILPNDTWTSLHDRAFDVCPGMLVEACDLMAQEGFSPEVVPQSELGGLYTAPNFSQWLTMHARVWKRVMRHRLLGS